MSISYFTLADQRTHDLKEKVKKTVDLYHRVILANMIALFLDAFNLVFLKSIR